MCVFHLMLMSTTFTVTAGDVSSQSVVWTDLLPEPGISGATSRHVPTYHNSMPIGNGQVVQASSILLSLYLDFCYVFSMDTDFDLVWIILNQLLFYAYMHTR